MTTEAQQAHAAEVAATLRALHERVAAAPDAPTDDWPGGWIIVRDGRTRTPHSQAAWRTAEAAQRWARPGDQIVWVACGLSAGALPIPLDADYWRQVDDRHGLVGVAEVARITGLSEQTIRTYVRRGTIPDPLPVAGSDALVWDRATITGWASDRPGRGRPRRESR